MEPVRRCVSDPEQCAGIMQVYSRKGGEEGPVRSGRALDSDRSERGARVRFRLRQSSETRASVFGESDPIDETSIFAGDSSSQLEDG